MTPAELYSRTPENVTLDIQSLVGCYYNFIPEIDVNSFQHHDWLEDNTRIEMVDYKNFDYDGRRFWKLSAIKFDNVFVMITQNAGREGDDHTARFITNPEVYKKMVAYIHAMLPLPDDEVEDITDINDDIPTLTKFYGGELDEYFERY